MSKHKLYVVQTYRAERRINITVEAEDMESARENVMSGAVDIPGFNDPEWTTTWDLQDEEIYSDE